MRNVLSILAVVALISMPAAASIIPVSGFEVADGGATYSWSSKLFDAQPTTDPVAGTTSAPLGSNTGFTADLGVDFGKDYASQTITHVYMLQGSYSDCDVVVNYYWSADMTLDAGDVAAPNFNLFNYLEYNSSTSGIWVLEYENLAGVTPEQRYLIGDYVSGNGGNFGYEAVFVNAVPEPATMGLVGLGALALIRRRR